MAQPQRTLDLLDQLEALGFTDEAYWRVHHFRSCVPPRKDTIARHRQYCRERVQSLPDGGVGERVQRRLELVLKKYQAQAGRTFEGLAEEAYREIPHLPAN